MVIVPRSLLRSVLHTLAVMLSVSAVCRAQTVAPSQPSTYRNPILFADYSDPDVIRDGDRFYLIASSFHFVPGIPILESRDLVHWKIDGHAVQRLTLSPAYDMHGGLRYGGGVWAPSVRFHDGLFYIFFPTPQEGIFVVTAPSMHGPWTAPKVVIAGPGLEDPCPFWDEDGNAYLVHSRLGAGPLILHRMAPDASHVLDDGKVIVQDPKNLPTLEGPKFYKRNGWYYIFAPMGGVTVGSQAVLRSRNIYGPYEHRIVLSQGSTEINGPHQGGYVETPDGRDWFLHFQSRDAHGRIVHLEPMRWVDDWPIIGKPVDATHGEPVLEAPMPVIVPDAASWSPQTSDDFSAATLAPMWEWNHNPDDARWSLTERSGFLRLHTQYADDFLHARNTLTETMQDDALQVTARLDPSHLREGDLAGLSVFDKNLHGIGVLVMGNGVRQLVTLNHGVPQPIAAVPDAGILLRARVEGSSVAYSWSADDGKHYQSAGDPVRIQFSWWKGARPAIFAYNTLSSAKDLGYVDVDWVHYEALHGR